MSELSPVPPSAAGDPASREPSMEEILASIRRIIADDQSLPSRVDALSEPEEPTASLHVVHSEPSVPEAPVPQAAVSQGTVSEPAATAEPADDVFADASTAPRGTITAPQYPSPEGPYPEPAGFHPEAAFEEAPHHDAADPADLATAEPAAFHQKGHDAEYFDPPEEYDRPHAPPTAAAASLFSATTNSSVSSAFNVLAASRLADNSEELLGLAREMIRPLLRSWLDENLPSMVERMVRDEIERVARGGH